MNFNCLTQKVELYQLIPAIRLELIRILENKGFSDAEISRRLKITKAAVSQYKHKKRGAKLKFPDEIKKKIKKSADLIIKGKDADIQTNSILNKIKQDKYICCVCKECEK